MRERCIVFFFRPQFRTVGEYLEYLTIIDLSNRKLQYKTATYESDLRLRISIYGRAGQTLYSVNERRRKNNFLR